MKSADLENPAMIESIPTRAKCSHGTKIGNHCYACEGKSSLAAMPGSASRWTSHLVALEQKTDDLREAAYKAGNYRLAAALKKIERAIYKEMWTESQTPNAKLTALPDDGNKPPTT